MGEESCNGRTNGHFVEVDYKIWNLCNILASQESVWKDVIFASFEVVSFKFSEFFWKAEGINDIGGLVWKQCIVFTKKNLNKLF